MPYPMQFFNDLRSEHQLIERVAGAMRGFVELPSLDAVDAREFVRFFERYAGEWHHGKEEDVLFPAMAANRGVSVARGPIAVLLGDHHRMASLLEEMNASIDAAPFDQQRFRDAAIRYVQSLLCHIDAENSVLFPECEDRLRRNAQFDLPSRAMTPAEVEARAQGELLVSRYPPVEVPEAIRGEGCVICPAYGESCDGIEREWWNEWQWEELDEHVAAS